MKIQATIKYVSFVFISTFILQGCGLIVPINIKKYSGTDSMTLEKWDISYTDYIVEVGKEMGYRVSERDKSTNSITLVKETTTLGWIITSKMNSSIFTFIPDTEHHTLNIKAFGSGNYAAGEEEIVMAKSNEFKKRLSEKINQSKASSPVK